VLSPSVADCASETRVAPPSSPIAAAMSARVSSRTALYASYPTCENMPTDESHER
jgi:hypothetical protein